MPSAEPGTEIELKFQVPAARLAALRRALGTASAETVELRALYFDTAEGALANAKLAWRLRREGGAWVQTLKGAGDGLVQRLEHEVLRDPADGDSPAPDPALHAAYPAGAALLKALGGQGVVLRHGTEITRLRRIVRHQGARIEAALDSGDVIAGARRAPLAELELELLSGDFAALLDLATRWAARFGLRPDPATKSERAQWLLQGLALRPVARGNTPQPPAGTPLGLARAQLVAAALAQALPNAAAITEGRSGPEHVHQLRVALRRLRSVLRALGPADALRDAALATLFAALGATRDADVLGATLAPAAADAAAAGFDLPAWPAPAAAIDPFVALSAPGTTRLWLMLLALTRPGPDTEDWAPVAIARLKRWHRQARKAAADWPRLDEPQRHHLRRRLKRLRYLLEFAAALKPKRAVQRELAALRLLQDALGRWNDLVVARGALTALPPSTGQAFAAGWVAAAQRAADADCARQAGSWRSLKRSPFKAGARRRRRRPR